MRPMALRRARILLTSLLLLATRAIADAPPSAAGHWEGSIDVPGSVLAMSVDLARSAEGAWRGDISIPIQNLVDFALSDVKAEGGEITFRMPGIPGDPTFTGKLAADGAAIAGVLVQGGASIPFTLARADAPAAAATSALEGFDEWVDAARMAWKVPGLALAIVKDGEVIESRGFGQRDVGTATPVTSKTLFAIGSCTKAFTTFAMGSLVEKGELDWDEPVTSYVPEFRLKDPATTALMTPRDLITHRSGLPRHDLVWYNATTLSRRDLVDRLRFLEPSAGLREKFQYNNLMYLTAGYVIERITGGSWEDAVRARILQPLGMARTNFSAADSQEDADFARPNRERNETIEVIPFRTITNMGPAGSINSCADDMARWLHANIDGGKSSGRALVSASTLGEIQKPQMVTGAEIERPDISPASYGFGWMVETYRGHQHVAHGGAIDGFVAHVSIFPKDRVGIVVLANREATPLPGLVARHAADRLLALEAVDWNGDALAKEAQSKATEKEARAGRNSARHPGTAPSHDLAAYAGTYRHPGYGELGVVAQATGLHLTYNGITTPLEHWHYDVFEATTKAIDPAFEDLKFNFRTNSEGAIESVVSQFEPALGEIVFERAPDARLSDPAYLARLVGDYDLKPQVLSVGLEGTTLTLKVVGQPKYHLVPSPGDRFVVREHALISVEFVTDETGSIAAMRVLQPEGVATARRK